MDVNGVKAAIQTYFDAGYESSSEKMAEVFHDVANLYGRDENGALSVMDKATFIKLVGSGALPEGQKPSYPRQDELLSIDFTGENTAVARLKIRVGNTMFTDVLSFINLGGKWVIIAKLYSGVPVD